MCLSIWYFVWFLYVYLGGCIWTLLEMCSLNVTDHYSLIVCALNFAPLFLWQFFFIHGYSMMMMIWLLWLWVFGIYTLLIIDIGLHVSTEESRTEDCGKIFELTSIYIWLASNVLNIIVLCTLFASNVCVCIAVCVVDCISVCECECVSSMSTSYLILHTSYLTTIKMSIICPVFQRAYT